MTSCLVRSNPAHRKCYTDVLGQGKLQKYLNCIAQLKCLTYAPILHCSVESGLEVKKIPKFSFNV